MPKKIEVVVTSDGRLETNFIGFSGEDCFDEADKLRRALHALGLEIDATEVVRKGLDRIALETGEREAEDDAKKARTGDGGEPR